MSTDPEDGRPVWSRRTGATLVPGQLAWRHLGTGHRSETWLTWSLDLWAPAVVKLPRPDQVAHPRALDALRREADALDACPHPGLPRLLAERLADPPTPHLVLEWIDGTALDDLVDDQGALPGPDALALGAALTAVLRRLHHHGVAHLDLKPANVMIRDGWPLLIDLGSARAFGRVPDGPIGSRDHTAPELEAGAAITPGMDLYGLGAVLRDALTGSEDPDADLPDGPAAAAVARLLAPDPADRPRTADEALTLLAAASDGPLWPRFAERRRRPHATSTRPAPSRATVRAGAGTG